MMNVGLVIEDRYRVQAQPAGMVGSLRRVADVVDVVDPRQLDDVDVVVARGRSEWVLRTLDHAQSLGHRTVNRPDAIRAVLDKPTMYRRLQAAELPLPETWCGSFPSMRSALRQVGGRLVVKPVRGDNARDVFVVDGGCALETLPWGEPDAVVQRFIPNDGFDIKLYGIGDQVWTVRKQSPLLSTRPVAELLPTTRAHVALAHRCRDAVGLDLYGVDCVATTDGLVVIEVNDFPNFSGIEAANDHLARFVLDRAVMSVGVA